MKSVAPSWLFLRKVGGRRDGWLRVGYLGFGNDGNFGAEARGGGRGAPEREVGFRE